MLSLRGLRKRYGQQVALDGIDLEVRTGEFVTLLGPSGCGKSTALRLTAGLLDPDGGEIVIDGQSVTAVPPHRRNVGLVFQSYALFPHMTVDENVAFGLRMQGLAKPVIGERVTELLRMVELSDLGRRYPRELSGGQQQRVALARAVVTRPKLLLLDEPLSNLDARLRDRLRVELRALQRRLGLTTLYVTHDQTEALALSDRIAVMHAGRIIEQGDPEQVYCRPHSRLTAEFLGIANLLPARVLVANGATCRAATALGDIELPMEPGLQPGVHATICLRPEDIGLQPASAAGLTARVGETAYLGSLTEHLVAVGPDGQSLRVHVPGRSCYRAGDRVNLVLPNAPVVIRDDGAAP
jgi:ABC-type Fe3+/spermidine/putrescine transport system ATPase subunit